jgi:ATP-dependent Lhr-like helicase
MTVPARPTTATPLLPKTFGAWFAKRGWAPRPHQIELLAKAEAGKSVLLIAPTGAGKTLAGFLPSLVDLARQNAEVKTRKPGMPASQQAFGPHTLYVSPLKALAVDIHRNLEMPVAEMCLPIRLETRTGDTPVCKRQRQKLDPPDMLLTTPEQVALLVASKDARRFFGRLKTVIFDELHSLVVSKRGDLLSLGLARLRELAPGLKTIGLSATVADPDALCAWLVAQPPGEERRLADKIVVEGGAPPNISIVEADAHVPWQGHTALYALPAVYEAIKRHKTTLLFVNTRWQAELLFRELWRMNDDALEIALHHGSLDRGQRRKVEAAMAEGKLRAVVATSTLDLGVDWGDVDLVAHVGAPKGASRLAQRIGRANHRMDEPSEGLLVPANRFEVLECRAALDANYLGHQDTPPLRPGALDVLAQHILGMAVAEPFDAVRLFDEITSSESYRNLTWETFERVVDFVATGGYALRSYERYAKIRMRKDGPQKGRWGITNPRIAQQYRLNVGTIVEAPMLHVVLGRPRKGMIRGGKRLGQIEEYFLETLAQGDTFRFAGRVLRFEGIRENTAYVTQGGEENPSIPSFEGGKFPLTTYLAGQVREILADRARWSKLPDQVCEWLQYQEQRSLIPSADQLLVETFPHDKKFYMAAFPFEGRLAHQTLGMLLTRRLERAGARPLGFVATDYSIAVWALRDLGAAFATGRPSLAALFDEDMLGDDLEAWMAESYLLKRTFRNCAVISGLIERKHPGQEKTGRQVTVSTDLVYDVLRTHEPDHILLQATRADAAAGLLDIQRLGEMLYRVKGRIVHQRLEHVSPLAVPVMLQIGREPVFGEAQTDILADAAEALIREAMGEETARATAAQPVPAKAGKPRAPGPRARPQARAAGAG